MSKRQSLILNETTRKKTPNLKGLSPHLRNAFPPLALLLAVYYLSCERSTRCLHSLLDYVLQYQWSAEVCFPDGFTLTTSHNPVAGSLAQYSLCQRPCLCPMLGQHVLSLVALSCSSERWPPPTYQLGTLSFGGQSLSNGRESHSTMRWGAISTVIGFCLVCEWNPVIFLGRIAHGCPW